MRKTAIMNHKIENIYPLTPLQEGMLYHSLAEPESAGYILQSVTILKPAADEEKIKGALLLLSVRYEALRTAIMYEKLEKPWQVVLEEREPEFQRLELRAGSAEGQEREFRNFLAEDLERGFNLQKDTLIRVTQVDLGVGRTRLIWTAHHMIMDGWCLRLLIDTFTEFYLKQLQGIEVRELRIEIKKEIETRKSAGGSYGDYIRWREGRNQQKALAYWSDLLDGYENISEIKPLRSVKQSRSREQMRKKSGSLSPVSCKKLLELLKEENITMNTVAETACGILLQKYTGSKDVVYGKVVSGRNAEVTGIEKMVGLFVNTIPVRVTETAGMSIRELLRKQQRQGIMSTEHDFCSLAEIQSGTSQGPELIKVLFVFENYRSGAELEETGQEGIFEFESSREQTNYAITISGFLEGEALVFNILYHPDQYGDEEVELILARLLRICEEIGGDPEGKAARISGVSVREEERILKEFNATRTPYPADKTVVELFEEQVMRTPAQIALTLADRDVCYAECNRMANSLAMKLRSLGVGAGDLVAVIAERSMEMILGICGIIKAGGVYVPIDPTDPEERIRYILADSNPRAVLVYQAVVTTALPVIDLAGKEAFENGCEDPEHVNSAADLIYCIYTSGTTGSPKGTLITHKNVIRLVRNTNYLNSNPNQVLLQTGALSFDASTFEIWGTLLNGGRLVLAGAEVITDARRMAALIQKNRVNTLWLTTRLFNQLLMAAPELFDGLETLLFGGEKVSEEHVRFFKARNNSVRLLHVYGPTEGTTFTTAYEIPAEFDLLPIGKPISNTRTYILQGDNLCGIGIPGELCIAGDGVCRGYLNLKELTAEKFVSDPYAPDGGGVMYRSGDLARWLPDGNIDFLGRMDGQVKIRGYRVEPGEIESQMGKIEGVETCVVISKPDAAGEMALYGYYTGKKEIGSRFVRERLSEKLPSYLIPSFLMQIGNIPVTANGKLDQKALPDIAGVSEEKYVAPGTMTEAVLCEIFAEILQIERTGIRDHFFELGGHSLKAVRLVNKIEARTGVRIAIRDIFTNPTVEKLARLAAAGKAAYEPILRAEPQAYYPMSSAQKRIYLICQMSGERMSYNIPGSIRLDRETDAVKMKAAVRKLIERHEILRTEFLEVEGELVQHICAGTEMDFESGEVKEGTDGELLSEFIRPFDLGKPSQFRMRLVKRADYTLLLFDMHHIISDGVSMNLFREELLSLYNGRELTALTHQYKDYSEWMRSRDLQVQKKYWIGQFADEIPVLEMPLDYPRPQKQNHAGQMAVTDTGRALGESIKQLARATGSTDYMIFLSALMILLGKYSRQEDIIIGSPVSARTHKDTERMLGMFVNTLVMRGKPEGEKQYLDFLSEVRESCLLAYEHQEYPFEELTEELEIKRDLSRNPLFDVMLVMHNEQERIRRNRLPGERRERVDIIAKFDMTFSISEQEEGYEILVDYCTALFREESIRQLLSHYLQVIRSITGAAEGKIKDITLADGEERNRILKEFNEVNETAEPHQGDKTVAELFEEQVRSTPGNTALVLEDREVSYNELNRMANSLGLRLRGLGVGPDDFVAIIAERGTPMIAGIFGVFKSGGAYVPIDPGLPAERIRFILEDCQPKAVLIYRAAVTTTVPVIDLSAVFDNGQESRCGNPGENQYENPVHVNHGNDLCYCIYTSGTTGNPKGVMIEHRSACHMAEYAIKAHEINEKDGILAFSTYVFDVSVMEMLMALLSGARLILLVQEMILDQHAFAKYCQEKNVTVMALTPNYFMQTSGLQLRVLITGGSESSRAVIEKAGTAAYSNGYGTTEGTVYTSNWKYVPGNEIPDRIPIGRPVSNTRVYILQGENLCGIGVPGELCIAGAGVARGYLNRPELTAEKFVENPFEDPVRNPNGDFRERGKMYRSGDLARWLPSGELEYLGRMDEQVKIRGYRIELGEIECRLREIEGVAECAVIARIDATGEKALYGYYTGKPGIAKISGESVREKLREVLPFYLIPSYLMQIEKLPLTRNGKLDEKALPDIDGAAEKTYEAPETPAEAAICEAFREVLQVEQVGVRDNFFTLGGDSIKALQVISKLRTAGYRASVRHIMSERQEGARKIAPRLTYEAGRESEQGEVKGKVSKTPIFCLFQQWELAAPHHFNQAVMLSVAGLSNESIRKAVRELILHHDMLRCVYRAGVPEILGVSESRLFDFYEYDVTRQGEAAETIRAACTRIQESMDLAAGPLVKAAVFTIGTDKVMMLAIHHLAVDGVSWRILTEDFYYAAARLEEKKAVNLPAKTASFIQWSEALVQYGKSERIQAQRRYWEKIDQEVKKTRLLLSGRTSISSGTAGTSTGAAIRIHLEKPATQVLLRTGEIQELLLSALAGAMNRLRGAARIAVTIEGHGREELEPKIDIDRTVGWFTSAYPVILNCYGQTEENLPDVREKLREIPDKGIGFGLLMAGREQSTPDITFNYLGDFGIREVGKYSAGASISDANRLSAPLNFNGGIRNGSLSFGLLYDRTYFEEEEMERLGLLYEECLEELAAYCTTRTAPLSSAVSQQQKSGKPNVQLIYGRGIGQDEEQPKSHDEDRNALVAEVRKYASRNSLKQAVAAYSLTIGQKKHMQKETANFVNVEISNVSTVAEISQAIKKLVAEQSALRSVYDQSTEQAIEYQTAHWYIPVIDEWEYPNIDNEFHLLSSSSGLLYDSGMASFIAIVKMRSGKYRVQLLINHVFWDRNSDLVFRDRILYHLEHPDAPVREQRYSDYLKEIINQQKELKVKPEISEIMQLAEGYLNYIRKGDKIKYSYWLDLQSEDDDYAQFHKNPIESILQIFVEMNECLKHLSHVPFLLLFNGRNEKNYHLLGNCLIFLPGIFAVNERTVRGGMQLVNSGDEGSAFLQASFTPQQIADFEEMIIVNYHGVFSEEYEQKSAERILKKRIVESKSNEVVCVINNQIISIAMKLFESSYPDPAQNLKTDQDLKINVGGKFE